MRKTVIIFILIPAFVYMLTSCTGGARSQAEQKVGALEQELVIKDSIINEVFTSLGAITSNLNLIKERENIITSSFNGGELGKEPVAQISEDLQAIDELLLTNREAMVKLEKNIEQLKRANVKIASLQTLVSELTHQMETRDGEIVTLKERLKEQNIELESMAIHVDDLSSQVKGLSDHKDQLEGEIRAKGDQLNIAYYIVGSRKDLIEKDIIYKSGFIGRTLKVNENRSLEAFVQIDIRDFDEVIIGKKGVDLVTTHPDGSYELVMSTSGVLQSLVITDKSRFWEYSKVLVLSYK